MAHDGRDRVRRSLRNDSGPRPAGHPSAETNNSVPASKATLTQVAESPERAAVRFLLLTIHGTQSARLTGT